MAQRRTVHRITAKDRVAVSGGRSLSSHIAELFEECGAHHGYSQSGQCKCCADSHRPPDFTSSNASDHKRMLELIAAKGWKWRWSEDSDGDKRLVLSKSSSESLSIVGASRDAALIIGTMLLCASQKQLYNFHLSYPKLYVQ